ncbi:aminodeoxychorismate/anthranilate synthase component II [Corynebacterium sp. TAE3-ERU12]|uniref:aminodeoxychorismate/anthranilate synthase component II n=1 Tax=Corynebacterium sp. TAE3-ERU12 TaxID=2849491 RepID=UPI001C44D5B1|nr:aminodeoxychorismate/anthranilate synthase component II [Corynebacterium sp. TAE3-ERU12]MBV7294361.1 aminodeoxychorismate/anthranilate synthase component II [Corynebacterium sp. TAE3-ERU12]
MRILVVDNYDSFVFNLVQYLGQLGEDTTVWRNDDPRLFDPRQAIADFDAVLVSPGPGNPSSAGQTRAIIAAVAETNTPLLGVCLGHQALCEVFGATVVRADELLHGKTSLVRHDGTGVLAGMPSPFTATRYHSLTVDESTLPDELIATAHTDSGMLMAVRHESKPLHGVQFHPESVLTQFGHRLLANWLVHAGGQHPEQMLADLEKQQEGYHAAFAAHNPRT